MFNKNVKNVHKSHAHTLLICLYTCMNFYECNYVLVKS
jgi:hypothetical protein